MIDRDITVTVKGRTATLSEEIFVYKNDGAIKYYFNVIDYAYRFSTENMIARAVIKTSNMTILKPNGDSFKTLRKPVVGDTVEFDLSKDLIDEANEVGDYQIQIHLFDLQDNRITIPAFKITVLDTIADVPEPNLAILNASYADKSYLSKEESHIDGPFQPGDLLTADNLNALHKFTLDTCEGTRDYIDQGLAQIKGEKEEVTNARGGLHYLKLRLERDREEVLQIMREDLYKSFKGERISADKSVKGVTNNLTVSGRTLQNLISVRLINQDIRQIDSAPILGSTSMFKNNTVYTLIYTVNSVNSTEQNATLNFKSGGGTPDILVPVQKIGLNKKTFSMTDVMPNYNILLYFFKAGNTANISDLMILEGDWTNKEVPPYFTGIPSVGQQRNLFNKETGFTNKWVAVGTTTIMSDNTGKMYSIIIDKIKTGMQYVVTGKNFNRYAFAFIDDNDRVVSQKDMGSQSVLYTQPAPQGATKLLLYLNSTGFDVKADNQIQVEEGTISSSYQEYNESAKISILTHGKNLVKYLEVGGILSKDGGDYNNTAYLRTNYIDMSNVDTIGIVNNIDNADIKLNLVCYYDINRIKTGSVGLSGNSTVSVPDTAKYCRIELKSMSGKDLTNEIDNQLLMVGKGIKSSTVYEPYKENKKEILLKEPGTMMYHPAISQGTIQATPNSTTERDDATRVRTGWFKCNNEKPFTVYGLTSTQKVAVLYFNEKKTNIGWTDWQNSVENKTLPSECAYIRAIFANRDNSSCTPEDFSAIFIDVFAIIPCLDGLKSLSNGVCDTLESREDGVYFVKRVEKVAFDGSESWTESSVVLTDVKRFWLSKSDIVRNTPVICSHFISSNEVEATSNSNECIFSYVTESSIGIQILSSKLSTTNTEGFKTWLKNNPVTVYYELVEPIETKLYDYYSTNLQTYKDMTYVQGDNFILPEISCEIPVKEQPVS